MKLPVLLFLCLLMACPAHAETIDEMWNRLPVDAPDQQAAEAGISFADLGRQLLAGEIDLSESLDRAWQAAREAAKSVWRSLAGVLLFACIGEMAGAFCGGKHSARALNLLCRIAAGVVLTGIFAQAAQETAQVCERLRKFTSAAAPLLSAALTLLGSAGMAAAMTPAAALADQIAVGIATDYGLLLLNIGAALAACAGLSGRFRLERAYRLCIGAVRWLLGGCMTGFLALMSVKTLLIGGRDGIAVQTARFAVDNLMPVIGGELADTVSGVFASVVLVKNTAGIAVCAALLMMTITPLAKLAAVVLMTKIASAAADLLSSQSVAGMLERFAQVLETLMALLAAVAALGMILAGAVVMTAAGVR